MTSDIDELMSRTELSPQDIDDLIRYHRNLRAKKAAGEKPAPKEKVNLTELLNRNRPAVTAAPIPGLRRI